MDGLYGRINNFAKIFNFHRKSRFKKRLKVSMTISELTQSEIEILNFLTNEFLTPKQIAIRRKTTLQAVYKIIKSLQKKGAYTKGLMKVEKSGVGIQPYSTNQLRIHNQQWDIRIIYKSEKYFRILEKASEIEIDNNKIHLWENKIDIYSNQNIYGYDIRRAMSNSMAYWDKFIAKLEHEIGCILKKPRSTNIKLVRMHIAETNNEISKEMNNKGERFLKVFTTDEGKLWFLIDNSFNLHEAEAVHSKTAKEDMEKVVGVFNDIRDNETYLPSSTKEMLDKMVLVSSNILEAQQNEHSIIHKTNESVNWLSENIRSHGPAWFGMSKGAADIKKEIRKLKAIISQRKLTEF